MTERLLALIAAEEILGKIIDQHGLEDYELQTSFVIGPSRTTRMTQVDQHLDHVIRIADWLLEEDNA